MQIRPVRPEEYHATGELIVHAYQAIRPHLEPSYAVELRDVANRVRSSDVYVAVDDDGHLLGSVTLVAAGGDYAEISDPEDAEFRMLAVAPEAQGRGVGQALVEHCIAEARARGKRALLLSSGAWMTTAHRLYERLGFRRTPERDWSPRAGLVLQTYRLDLS
jgi:GNAT superfamily N-acetyltransferase